MFPLLKNLQTLHSLASDSRVARRGVIQRVRVIAMGVVPPSSPWTYRNRPAVNSLSKHLQVAVSYQPWIRKRSVLELLVEKMNLDLVMFRTLRLLLTVCEGDGSDVVLK